MLNMAGAPNGKQSPLFAVLGLSSATPEGIIKANSHGDVGVADGLVIGLCFAGCFKANSPAPMAWTTGVDPVEGSCEWVGH
jgi:hypothetical protein